MNKAGWDFLQETLDVEVRDEMSASAQRQVDRRGSLSRMVHFAVDRGYATSVGDLLDQAANLRQHKLFNTFLVSAADHIIDHCVNGTRESATALLTQPTREPGS